MRQFSRKHLRIYEHANATRKNGKNIVIDCLHSVSNLLATMVEPHAVLLVIKHSAVKAVRILYAATLLPEHTQHQPFSGPENGFSQTITLLYLSQWHTKHNGSISTTIEIDTFFSQRKRDTFCNKDFSQGYNSF